MQEAKHDISKVSFQLERFIFFSDGVFAICITLLVIEIKVPSLSKLTDQALLQYLSATSLKFFGFLLSFCIIGHYWIVHHRIFGYVKKSTSLLLWLNLAFLLTIVLLPFSSGLFGEYGSNINMYVPYLVYVLNMCLTGIVNCWLWVYVSNPKRDMLTHKIPKARIHLGIIRSLIIPFIFILSLLVSLVFPLISRFIPLFIPLILNFGLKGLEKKAYL